MTEEQIMENAKFEAKEIIPARKFVNDSGQTIYSKVYEGTMEDIRHEDAQIYIVHAFAIVEASSD